jgi:hypothetical protein
MLEPHDPYCLCDRCIECMRLAREYPPPFSWVRDVVGPLVTLGLFNLFMWYLIYGQYS